MASRDITEVLKDNLERWYANPQAYEEKKHARLLSEQKRGLKRTSKSMRKYIQGQRVLADWLQVEYEECVSVWRLIDYSTPKALYAKLRECGYVWDTKRTHWRLHARLKAPRHSHT